MESYDLPPVMSEDEQQELDELATALFEDVLPEPEGRRRLHELVRLACADMNEWREYLGDRESEETR